MDIITEFIIPSMIAILASVFFGIAAPLFKQSTQKLGPITIDMFKQNKLEVIKQILNKYFITASALQIFGWLIFLTALSAGEVTTVAPILSFTYVVTAIYSRVILKEKLTWKEVLGITLIIIGVIILTVPI